MRAYVLATVIACSGVPLAASAEPVDPVQAMQQASVTPQQQNVRGVLSLYWRENQVRLALNSDAASQQQLYRNTPNPKALAHTRADMKFVDLHWRGSEAQLQHSVQAAFGELTQPFWQQRRGILNLPAQVRIQNFQLYNAECDQYYFQADLISLARDTNSKTEPIYADSCANGIQLEQYTVSAQDGYANLRAAPNTNAAVLQRLRKGSKLVALAQQGAWLQVQSMGTDRNSAIGFVHQSQVKRIEIE